MFAMVAVDNDKRKCLEILLSLSMNESIKHYELNSVTFGAAPGSFSATRLLRAFVDEHCDTLPLAAKVIARCCYVDELLYSVDSIVEGLKIRDDECMTLCKFSAKDPSLLDGLSDSLLDKTKQERDMMKVIGIQFDPDPDELVYMIKCLMSGACTKIIVLFEIGHSNMSIIAAKSRDAPETQEMLSRLELCASVLLETIVQSIEKILVTKCDCIRCRSDTTIVLH
jgi:hypothetical protein